MSTAPSDFDTLLAAHLTGPTTPAQQAQLAAFLRSDPALRAAYVRQLRLDSALRFAHSNPALVVAAAPASPSPRPLWWLPTVAATAAALLLAAIWTSSRLSMPSPRPLRDWPALVERQPGTLFGELPPSPSESISTRFLLPTHLLVTLP